MEDAKKDKLTTSNAAFSSHEDVASKVKTDPTKQPTYQHRLCDVGIIPPRNAQQGSGPVFSTLPRPPEVTISRVEGVTAEIDWTHEYGGPEIYRYEISWWSDETDRRSDYTNSKNYFLTNLKYSKTYYTKVTWIKGNATEGTCASKTVRFDTAPAPPVDLHVENYPPSPHDSFLIYFKDMNRGRRVTHEITVEDMTGTDEALKKPTSNRKVVVHGLKPGVTYSIAVKTKEGEEDEEGYKESETTYYDTPVMTYPAVPERVEVTCQDGKLKFKWKRLEIRPSYYEVQWETNGAIHVGKTQEDKFILEDVMLSTSYKFKVAAVNKAGHGYFSETIPHHTDPAPPQNVSVQRNLQSPTSSFIVHYEDTDILTKSYEIFATNLQGDVIKHVRSETHTAVINDLPEGSPHYIYVVAISGERFSKPAYCTRNMDT